MVYRVVVADISASVAELSLVKPDTEYSLIVSVSFVGLVIVLSFLSPCMIVAEVEPPVPPLLFKVTV